MSKPTVDKHGNIIKEGYYVKFTGICEKTDIYFSLTRKMKSIIETQRYIQVSEVSKYGLRALGVWWHCKDAEVRPDFTKMKSNPPKKKEIVTFDPSNLEW